jgi:DNA-binding transcriptional MerR regulator
VLGEATGPHFTTGHVIRVIGVSRRQLQYWAETGLVAPSARTPGGHRRYTFADLVALKAAKQLIDAGVSVQRIRSSIGALKRMLPQVRHPLSELVLVATGDVVLVLREGAVFEALSGQEWIVEVARFQREIELVLGPSEAPASKPAATKQPGPRTAVKVAARLREEVRTA